MKIEAAKALIGWNYDSNMQRVRDVIVLRQPDDCAADWIGPPAWQTAFITTGACMTEWMKGDPRYTPAGALASMLEGGGFVSQTEAHRALTALAQIEGMEWVSP